jgi:hypothetical protein
MLYRRHPYINRKYVYYNNKNKPGSKEQETQGNMQIPLPNQVEETKEPNQKGKLAQRSSFLDIIRERIHIEEIILFGLIILFLKEGIEDELITILLIYILLG